MRIPLSGESLFTYETALVMRAHYVYNADIYITL